ncbi:MAG: helix-turn-helix domain-containing protein, partial [Sphaerospermopsis sp. SIO1G2]|nr:helix-turn-helix domain-containing protein [Sphaerospermopsis sp. SIO1G2]
MSSYTGTQSVVRVLRLLKLFNGEQRAWTLNELVEASQLNKTTVFRMLTALESEGMLERTAHGDYQLGIEMIALGGRAVRNNDLRTVAHPVMQELVTQINERMTLEQLVMERDGSYAMMITDEVNSNFLIRINQEIGTRLPIH